MQSFTVGFEFVLAVPDSRRGSIPLSTDSLKSATNSWQRGGSLQANVQDLIDAAFHPNGSGNES